MGRKKDPLRILSEQMEALQNAVKLREEKLKRFQVMYNKQAKLVERLRLQLRESMRKTKLMEAENSKLKKQLLTEKRKKFDPFGEDV